MRPIVLLALLLTACNTGPSVTGNQSYVTVNTGSFDEARALPLAERHCSQYGKSPRYTRMDGVRFSYDCI